VTRLCVVRHAIAEERDVSRWPDDALRPLTPEGEERFRSAARGLRRVVPRVDVVLSSPYVRAWRTAELLHEEAEWPVPTRCDALRAERPPEEAAAEARSHPASSLAVVGHEPQLSQLVSLLLTGNGGAALDLKKGGVVCLDLEDGAAVLRWYATPRILRLLAG
jgi:phosphohistidine phosphatase